MIQNVSQSLRKRLQSKSRRSWVICWLISGSIKDYEFYVGESMDPEGAVGLLNYREDGITPFFTFFKDGLKIEKL